MRRGPRPAGSRGSDRRERGATGGAAAGTFAFARARALAGALAIGGVAAALAGCPTAHPRPTEVIKSADELIAAAAAPSSKVIALLGDMKVDSFDRKGGGLKGKVKADASFILRRPDELRIDVMDLGGVPLVTAVSSPAGFALYDMAAMTYYYGPPTPCSLEHLLGLPFGPEDLVRVMMGNPPLLAGGTRTVRYDGKTGDYELRIVRGADKQECRFEARGPRLRECTLEEGGKITSRLSYESWDAIPGLEGATLPRKLFYERPAESSDVLIRIKKVWIPDSPLMKETFALEAPTGVTIVPVCADGESAPFAPAP